MIAPSSPKPTKRVRTTIHNANSVDVLRGHPLGERVLARQAELEQARDGLHEGSVELTAIDTALSTLDQFLSADFDHLTDVTARDLTNWLERNKYLALTVGKKHVH
ncbi:hypothetical protein BH11MYX1_BH11MYX1_51960 [soil metagenome]